ncbi:collagen-like protein mcl1 [Phlyctema vagabunda]|uniref:Collagen-like protein mcl1 n=1 Tax=Phlyctema vagabunda TaxID=108571 RepID=A0ABR4PQV9_9HELO
MGNMYHGTLAVALLCVPVLAWNPLVERQTSSNDEELYLNSVCLPNVTDPIPPCQEVINLQQECAANGTSPLALVAHAQCMCGGSFFSNWIGCLTCNFVHGARSEQTFEAFNTIITSASHALCTGTPTADFTAIFNSITNLGGGAAAATGATSLVDQFPSNPAVSLYYTATGPQGAGAITGSATLATASVTSTSTRASGTTASRASTTASATGAAGTSGAASSSSSSSSAAAATGAVLGHLMAVVAGGALVAAAAL